MLAHGGRITGDELLLFGVIAATLILVGLALTLRTAKANRSPEDQGKVNARHPRVGG